MAGRLVLRQGIECVAESPLGSLGDVLDEGTRSMQGLAAHLAPAALLADLAKAVHVERDDSHVGVRRIVAAEILEIEDERAPSVLDLERLEDVLAAERGPAVVE
jgi:hypothetical protein